MKNREESILFESIVSMKEYKSLITLNITNSHIILKKPRKLFKNKFKEIYTFPIKRVKAKSKLSEVIISYNGKETRFECKNLIDAKIIAEKIINVQTGTTSLQRGEEKIRKVRKNVETLVGIASSVVSIAIMIKKAIERGK